jgi:hypothetical protein
MSAAPATALAGARRSVLLGRTFLHPALDYALIGGGLSLIFALAVVLAHVQKVVTADTLFVAALLLAINSTHFAASTVRLYTKPGAFASWPALTRVVPLAFLLLLTLAVAFPTGLGGALTRLYLTWSPYHYAAQTYGLCVMYCYRSGCALSERDRAGLRWASLLPFLHNFLTAPGIGLDWALSLAGLGPLVWLEPLRAGAAAILAAAAALVPLGLFLVRARGSRAPMPLIVPLLMIANGVWWLVLLPQQAFLWATIFHGIQYLAIVVIFHVRDQLAQPGNRGSGLQHALRFYAMSLALAFALFQIVPQGYVLAGFGMVESLLLVVAIINIHHFVVDAYIWRLRAGSDNRRNAEAGAPSPAA